MDKLPRGKEMVVYSDCFLSSKKLSHPERLANVATEIARVIDEYKPEALGIETLFFSKNVTTALPVAEARGVIVAVAAQKGLAVREFSPAEIKIAVTGYGRSEKAEIIKMIPKIVEIDKKIQFDDEYDAIACGITFFAIHR
jgi:crossover junction endodeoxyribonuclease RuvC